ncbi:MAG: PdxA family protein [bacterium]
MTVVVSTGDPAGVSPRLIGPLLDVQDRPGLVFVGPPEVHDQYAPEVTVVKPDDVDAGIDGWITSGSITPSRITSGSPNAQTGEVAFRSFKKAHTVTRKQKKSHLLTLPLSKKWVQEAGYGDFRGHTEYLERKVPGNIVMTFWGKDLNVALQTRHIPLDSVSGEIDTQSLLETVRCIDRHFREYEGYVPSIALLGVNPHAGESGSLGEEEQTVVKPAVERLNEEGVDVDGPFPADGFLPVAGDDYNMVLAMYHDQGLAPFKLNHFYTGIHATLGLDFLRASPVHGTAFDRVSGGEIDTTSATNALEWIINRTSYNTDG